MDYQYELLDQRTAYHGFLRMLVYRLRHQLYAGGWSPVLERDCLERGEVVAVLPYDPEQDQVVLIEQFRIGAVHGSGHAWLWEIIAGEIGRGETPEQVAYREALEEANCRLTTLVPIAQYFVSPGSSAERVHLFCGRVDSDGLGGVHGLANEHEDIRVEVVSRQQALADVAAGRIQTSPALIALQWLALQGDELRRQWLGIDW